MSRDNTALADTAEKPSSEKPSRTFTKQMTVINVVFAWAAIAASIWLGREMADLIVPTMVVLIASLLGIYQGVGHFDLRALRPNAPEQAS